MAMGAILSHIINVLFREICRATKPVKLNIIETLQRTAFYLTFYSIKPISWIVMAFMSGH